MLKSLLPMLGKNKVAIVTALVGYFICMHAFNTFWDKFGPDAVSGQIRQQFSVEVRAAEQRSKEYADAKAQAQRELTEAQNKAVLDAVKAVNTNVASLARTTEQLQRMIFDLQLGRANLHPPPMGSPTSYVPGGL